MQICDQGFICGICTWISICEEENRVNEMSDQKAFGLRNIKESLIILICGYCFGLLTVIIERCILQKGLYVVLNLRNRF